MTFVLSSLFVIRKVAGLRYQNRHRLVGGEGGWLLTMASRS